MRDQVPRLPAFRHYASLTGPMSATASVKHMSGLSHYTQKLLLPELHSRVPHKCIA